jgi:hypothetical protein
MSQGTISSEVNKRLCEAFDCFAEATIFNISNYKIIGMGFEIC